MKKFLTLSLCALAMFSCSQDGDVIAPLDAPRNIAFTSEINTRVHSCGFEIGDTISVAAYDGEKAISNNSYYGYDGYYFDSETPIQYQTADQKLTFSAVYPAQKGSNITTFDFIVEADQSSAEAREMSDLLVAVCNPTSERKPELIFDHVMSNIVINVIPADKCVDAVLEFKAQNTATCNIEEQSYTAKGNTTAITALRDVDTRFKSIIAPQTINTNSTFATLTVGDKVYEWTPLENLTFESGHQYSFTWDLDINNVIPQGIINGWEGSNGEANTDIIYSRLKDYSSTSYPKEATTWVIYDVYASTDSFDGLQDALHVISTSEVDTREISLEFPNLVSVPNSALYSSYSGDRSNCLVSISLPSATSIGSSAFNTCISLSNVYLPKVLSIGSNAFNDCSSLLDLTLESIVSVGSSAFSSIDNLVSVSLPNAVTIGSNAFSSCSNLRSVSLPNVIFLESGAFSICEKLIDIYIPNVTTLSGSVFNNCSSLVTLSMPKFTTYLYTGSTSIFYRCSNLKYLTIATESKIIECRSLFNNITTDYMFLTIGKENEVHVKGNVFSTFNTEGATTDYTFYEIKLVD